MGYARRLLWFQHELATAPAASAAGLALTLYTFCELFAGTRAWSQGLEMLDLVGKSFDAIYTVSDESICNTDFLTPAGFLRVLPISWQCTVEGSSWQRYLAIPGFLLQEFYRQAYRDPWK